MRKELCSKIIDLITTLQNLCEGFDEVNSVKKTLLTSKIKILLEIKKCDKLSPTFLIDKVGLAKSNLALMCNGLIDEGLITKLRDENDKRVIYYSLTPMGLETLNKTLKEFSDNFKRTMSYKQNDKEIEKLVDSLLKMVK